MFEAWQAQQRALKDEERRAKSAAAAALQNYRKDGLSEEETKLAAIREQERLQKLEAERKLRDYRGQMSEDEARLVAQRQEELRKKHLMEEQLRNNGVVTGNTCGIHASLKEMENSGAVSAIAAQYTSPKKESKEHTNGTTPTASRVVVAPGGNLDEASFQAEGASTTAVMELPQALPLAAPMETERSMAWTEPTMVTTEPSHSQPPQALPFKVSFVFGIVKFTDDTPQVDGYLACADRIVKKIITENPNTFDSIASSVAYPAVKYIEKDYARTDANRYMVTVNVEFSSTDSFIATKFQQEVVNAVKVAIADERFTKD